MPDELKPPETPQIYRNHERYSANFAGFIEADGHEHACQITDISPFGAKAEFAEKKVPFTDQQTVKIRIPNVGQCSANLCWTGPRSAGLAFQVTADKQAAVEHFLLNVLAEDM